MCTEVVLRNYSEYDQYMVWNGYTCELLVNVKTLNQEQGIVGYTENKELVGVFIRNFKIYFLNNNVEIEIDIMNFKCTNFYIDKKSRHFRLENKNNLIYELVYEPYIDLGILIYDGDPGEFDFLLFLSNNILENRDALQNYRIAMVKNA